MLRGRVLKRIKGGGTMLGEGERDCNTVDYGITTEQDTINTLWRNIQFIHVTTLYNKLLGLCNTPPPLYLILLYILLLLVQISLYFAQ